MAEPTVITIYNKGQFHERRPIAYQAGSADWFAVSEALAREAVGAFDPAAASLAEPFRLTNTQSTPALYRRQRAIFDRAERKAASLAATLAGPVSDVAEAQLSFLLPALARAPPFERPPLFIVHCALLI